MSFGHDKLHTRLSLAQWELKPTGAPEIKTHSMSLAQWLDIKESKDALAFKQLE